ETGSSRPAQATRWRAIWCALAAQLTGRLWPLWALTALAFVSAFAATWICGAEFVQPILLRLVGPSLLVLATILIGHAARGARWALPALILLTAADLGVYGCSYAIWPATFKLEEALATILDA